MQYIFRVYDPNFPLSKHMCSITLAGQVRMSPESDTSDSESVEEKDLADMTTHKKSSREDEEGKRDERTSPFDAHLKRPSKSKGGRSASRERDRPRRSRSHGERKRRSHSRSGREKERKEDKERKERREKAEPEEKRSKGSERPPSPRGKPPKRSDVQLVEAGGSKGADAGTWTSKVRCRHCRKMLTSHESGQKMHMYLNLYCIRCQLWNKLPEANRTDEQWHKTLEQAQAICAERKTKDQRDAEAEVMAPTRSHSSSARKSKWSQAKALPLNPPSPSGGDTESEPSEKPRGKSKKAKARSSGSNPEETPVGKSKKAKASSSGKQITINIGW